MNISPLGSAELELFQDAIERRLGLRFDEGRLTFLAEVLDRRVAARRLSPGAYLAALLTELEASDELAALARELTVGETYFFRHVEQFNAFREVALPERLSARAASRSLRILSAGCASGEEPYSLSILLRERGLEPGYEATVLGLDLNPDSLAKARAGVYSPWSLRETSPEVRDRWFQPEGRAHRLVRSLRDSVRFEQHNLILESPHLLAPGSLDVVFCRNVLMYFTPEQASGIVERLARALAPGGFLFIGHAETLRGLSHSFHLRHTHGTFYYQRRDMLGSAVESDLRTSFPAPQPRETARDSTEWVAGWVDAVARSSQRIRELEAPSAAELPRTAGAPTGEPTSRAALRDSLQLLGDERFGEALQAMHGLSPSERSDPAALLLRAALLTHQGDVVEAEGVCHDLLRHDDLNAGAHYLLALCHERRGQASTAVEHDRIAVYLDPEFAMPHLHLGLMARRRRDAVTARQELSLALLLLEREEAARLLLFGGGFSRNALLGLCRSELAHLGGGS
jgi:chemotaxis protein methyltransferase CheR